jgi:hypothetical protein
MGNIPLDLQRRFEQRWAARFFRLNPPTAPEKHPPESQSQQPAKAKEKTRRVKAASLISAPAV